MEAERGGGAGAGGTAGSRTRAESFIVRIGVVGGFLVDFFEAGEGPRGLFGRGLGDEFFNCDVCKRACLSWCWP